ncbi:MAG: GFA family protein [Alphaproteobacteria bacterium]|nr:GFA family protein [Alphaproteobacteria bacterium]MBU0794360.1 GFA family protein [Alphaproteobacteria bacterium]MBU0875229.1 GFA family protein [Alphaproteobacteria bacterium]MBU1768978.1 GFA family protein [Alphaproteobacteria bacterium]
MSKTERTGGCLCGAIRFSARGEPLKPHSCSCGMCRRHTGVPFTAWVEFPRDDVRWTGPGGAPATWRSSPQSSRAFCPTCGSSLGAIDDAPIVALLVGAFDRAGDAGLMPVAHAHRSARPKRWARLLQPSLGGEAG